MEVNQKIKVEIIELKNIIQMDLVDIQEMEIEEIIATKMLREENTGKLLIKESKNYCKVKGLEKPIIIAETLVFKDKKLVKENYVLFPEK